MFGYNFVVYCIVSFNFFCYCKKNFLNTNKQIEITSLKEQAKKLSVTTKNQRVMIQQKQTVINGLTDEIHQVSLMFCPIYLGFETMLCVNKGLTIKSPLTGVSVVRLMV